MQFFVEHARKTDVNIPILCGGAAINSNYINRIAKQDGIYEPGMFYCGTMFDGLKTMDKLVSEEKDEFVNNWKDKLSTIICIAVCGCIRRLEQCLSSLYHALAKVLSTQNISDQFE